MNRLTRGDLPPEILTPPPGPRSRELGGDLSRVEAPGINTLYRGRPGPVWAEALGANVLDLDGNRYVDLTAGFGVAAVGHRHPRVVEAIRRQAGELLHGLGDVHTHPTRVELARRLAARVPVDDAKIYFGVSGADGVEIALQTALLATGRREILAFDPAYHGLTLGALNVTSRPAFREPFRSWLEMPVHRLPYGGDLEEVEKLLARGTVGAVIFEPVVGREGVRFPPPGWLDGVARRARRHGTLTISDEIFVGFGRTGHWFGVDADGVRPDLLVCGKALGGGLPIAAVAGGGELMEAWATDGEALHTATFVANPLAAAAALAVLDVLEESDLPGRAARLGKTLLGPGLQTLAERFAPPGPLEQVAYRGLLAGLRLTTAEIAGTVALGLLARGVIALAGGEDGRRLQIAPPLVVHEDQLTFALDALEQTLEDLGDTA